LRGSASVNVIELPKQKRGGANQKNRSAAAQTKKTEARRRKPPER